jgi:hypothetical protein
MGSWTLMRCAITWSIYEYHIHQDGGELAALAKLTANWRSVVEDNLFTATEQADRKRGQKTLFE